jgi:uncharacterized protein
LKPITATFSNDGFADAGSPGVRVALSLLRGYKVVVSPLFRGSCRFLPSCSDYAAEAIRRHGLTRGVWLAARRLARCHPLCKGGYDPVPAARPGAAGRTE